MDHLKNFFFRILGRRIDICDLVHVTAPDGFWISDLNKPEDFWASPVFIRSAGLNGGHANGIDGKWTEHIHPEDLKVIKKTVWNHANGEVFEQPVRYRGTSGEEILMTCHGMVIHDDETGKEWLLAAHRITEQPGKGKNSSGEEENGSARAQGNPTRKDDGSTLWNGLLMDIYGTDRCRSRSLLRATAAWNHSWRSAVK
jgi:hypothetical protein